MSAPTITGASFTNAANSSISLKFSEPVTLVNASGLGLTRMTAEGDGWWQSTWIGIWGVNGSGTSTLTIATHDLLRPASVARVQYEFSRGGIADLDGNKLLGQEVWIGGSGTSIIDLSDYYPNLPLTAVTVYGNGGADVLTGTRGRDTLVGGADADTLVGDGGADRIDLVENRFVGMKSRGVYETPGGTILLAAHRAIESITLDRGAAHLKDELMPRYAELIYNGLWFAPEREMLQAAIDKSQEHVEGEVSLELYKGNTIVTGRSSAKSLYSPTLVTFEDDKGAYDQKDAQGFIKLNALRLRTLEMRNRS